MLKSTVRIILSRILMRASINWIWLKNSRQTHMKLNWLCGFMTSFISLYHPRTRRDSAELAKSFIEDNGLSPECAERVYELILLTKGHADPNTYDAKLMIDIDLSILGSDPGQHMPSLKKMFARNIKIVPSMIFRKKRKEILQSFLDRPFIYQTPYFSDRLEKQAKHNLKVAIETI